MTALDVELRQPLQFPCSGLSIPSTIKGANHYADDLEKRWVIDQRRVVNALRHLNLANAALIDALASHRPRLNVAVGLGEVQLARAALVASAKMPVGAA